MLKKSVRFPLDYSAEVRMIQRTYNNTWTMLIEKYDELHYESDGTEIQVYALNVKSFRFELVSESKIFVPFQYSSSAMIIDLRTGSGLICMHQLSVTQQFETVFSQFKYPHSYTFWYFSESSLEQGRTLLEYKHSYKLIGSQFDWWYHHAGNKANEHSLITLYLTRPDNTLALLLHDVVLDQGQAKSRVRYLHQMGLSGSLWQLSESTYLQYFYQKPLEGSFKVKNRVLKNEEESKDEQIVVKSFPFKPEKEQWSACKHIFYPIVLILDEGICWKLEEQQLLKIFDVPSCSWEIISQEKQWPCYKKDRTSKIHPNVEINQCRFFSQSSLNPSVLFEHYINEDNQSFTVIPLDFFRKKDKLMQLLLDLHQDFDDNLLSDCIQVLTQDI